MTTEKLIEEQKAKLREANATEPQLEAMITNCEVEHAGYPTRFRECVLEKLEQRKILEGVMQICKDRKKKASEG